MTRRVSVIDSGTTARRRIINLTRLGVRRLTTNEFIKENEGMLLYRLQHKQTKKFFAGIRWYDGKIIWTETGAFYRTPDTMRKHLEYLIGEYVQREKDGFPRNTSYKHHKQDKRQARKATRNRNAYWREEEKFTIWKRVYRGKLNLYRVVINDVLVKGEKFVQAKNFIKQPTKKEG